MSKKKVIIVTATAVGLIAIVAGGVYLAGHQKSELLQMINRGDSIEIEVAAPLAEAEQGEESSILWEKLALLTTAEDLRSDWENILGITGTGETKNGMLYINTNGEQDANNTLNVALHNSLFTKELTSEELATAVANYYTDIEADETTKAVYMGINAYFNLLPDAEPNYSNADATLQRNEFMAMVFRANTPVSELTANSAFETAVGKSDLNIYAQGESEKSYLTTIDKSLNNQTANGTMTRAEAVYLLVQQYFADEYKNVDLKSTSFTDAKDGGDIATSQQFAGKDYATSYELVYSLQNPDKGLPTNLYKALIVAKEKGIITDSESRWDEGITKSEAIELLVNAIKADDSITNYTAKLGAVKLAATEEAAIEQADGEVAFPMEEEVPALQEGAQYTVEDITPITMYATGKVQSRFGPDADGYETATKYQGGEQVILDGVVHSPSGLDWYRIQNPQTACVENGEQEFITIDVLSDTAPQSETPAPVVESTIQILEELDKDMYVVKTGNVREGDTTTYTKIGSITSGSTIHVTGKTSQGWFRVDYNGSTAYVSNTLLSDTKPTPVTPKPSTTTQQPSAGTTTSNGGTVRGDGSILNPDGSVTMPDGSTVHIGDNDGYGQIYKGNLPSDW